MTLLSSWMQFKFLECFFSPLNPKALDNWCTVVTASICCDLFICPRIHLPLKLNCVPDDQAASPHTHRDALPSGCLASANLQWHFCIWNPFLAAEGGRGWWTENCWSGLAPLLWSVTKQNLYFSGYRIGLFTETSWKQREMKNLIHWHRSSWI